MEQNIITIKNLSKTFKRQKVLKEITIKIPENCVYGLLGPNGAGKSTLLKTMTGLLKPTSGEVLFCGHKWSRKDLSAYLQVIGVALPFVISMICAGSIALEEQNHFQIYLGSYTDKGKAFTCKSLVLSIMGFLAICSAVLLFGAGYHFLPGKSGISGGLYMQAALLLFLGSIPLYVEHIFLNLLFTKSVSQCVGVVQSLVSALFLTGLGEGRWQFLPCTWSARVSALFLQGKLYGRKGMASLTELKGKVPICLLLLCLMCVIIRIVMQHYEGRQVND